MDVDPGDIALLVDVSTARPGSPSHSPVLGRSFRRSGDDGFGPHLGRSHGCWKSVARWFVLVRQLAHCSLDILSAFLELTERWLVLVGHFTHRTWVVFWQRINFQELV